MKAIYEIVFNTKDGIDRDRVSDTRRMAATADNRGFMKVAKWATDACGPGEFVATIRMIASERP